MEKLLHSPFDHVARNTIDYWMKPDSMKMTTDDVLQAIANATWQDRSTLQLYLHIPYCAQKCSFCAFSGGNTLNFDTAKQYTELLIWQTKTLLQKTQAYGRPVRSVNIGGGSPDLIKGEMNHLLEFIHSLLGVSKKTEISVEFTLSTVTDDFIEALMKNNVTKASFGVQIIDPVIRAKLRMPSQLKKMDSIVEKLATSIPIINVDLMTGFPGQTIESVLSDLAYFIQHKNINSISSYLLTQGAAPALLADIETKHIGSPPSQEKQALFRLHTYATLLRAGWIRKGTNTYMNPNKIPHEILERVAGNECIGARRHEDFLIGAGAQAISSLPGVRVENVVDIDEWMNASKKGQHAFALEKCAITEQEDMALWVFPLIHDGLKIDEYETMRAKGAIDSEQQNTFQRYLSEGLIIRDSEKYTLSIIGEVFMGHLVRGMKKIEDQRVIDTYITEGHTIGKLLADNKLKRENKNNNRQLFAASMRESNE